MWSRFSSTCTSYRRPILGISERETGEGRPRARQMIGTRDFILAGQGDRPVQAHPPAKSSVGAAVGSPGPGARLRITSTGRRDGITVAAVTYATRPMHDADSHIMEPADWLHPYLDDATRARFPKVWTDANEDTTPGDAVERATALHHDPSYRADDEAPAR